MNKHTQNTGPEKEPRSGNLEAAKTPELSSLLSALGTLRASIQNNEPLDVSSVREIEKKAGAVHVQMTGENHVSLEEAKKDPNVEIWIEIQNGTMDRIRELTSLPAQVVKNAPESIMFWNLTNLHALDEETARALAARNKTQIDMNTRTDISTETADILASHVLMKQFYDVERNSTRLSPGWARLICANYKEYSSGILLRAEFDHLEELTPEIVREFFYEKDPSNAKNNKGWPELVFPALKFLDEATAQAMADNPRLPEIQLDPRTRFTSPKVAEILLGIPNVRTCVESDSSGVRFRRSNNKGRLHLPFETDPSYPAWLVKYHVAKCPEATVFLFFCRSKFPSLEQIEAASSFRGPLFFGCEKLTPEEAGQLARLPVSNIELTFLNELSQETADALGKFPGKIQFSEAHNDEFQDMIPIILD